MDCSGFHLSLSNASIGFLAFWDGFDMLEYLSFALCVLGVAGFAAEGVFGLPFLGLARFCCVLGLCLKASAVPGGLV